MDTNGNDENLGVWVENLGVWVEETFDPDFDVEVAGADSGTLSATETAHILVLEDVSEHPLTGHGYEQEDEEGTVS